MRHPLNARTQIARARNARHPIAFWARALALCVGVGLAPVAAIAQSQFSPAYLVNDKVITNFEIEQRRTFLALLRAPGDPDKLAREQLIEERLKMGAAEQAGTLPADDAVAAGMAEFAGRVNMDTEQFLRAIDAGGVTPESFREFVRSGIAWRDVVRARFAGKVQVSDRDVDRAIQSASGGSSVRVLLSEIIMAAPPAEAAAVQARAGELAQITTEAEFASAAGRFSAAGTRGRGGRLDWMPITNLPPALRPIILGLAPGQVTQPIPLEGAVALFQLRAIEETGITEPEYSAIEYAAYYIPGGRSPAALQEAARVAASIDTCDDLYGIAKGKPAEVLERGAKPVAEIPRDVALELAKLDRHEISTTLTRADGQTLVLLMLCGRTPVVAADAVREDILAQLQDRRLQGFADSYLEELRADARIVEK